MKLCSPIFFLFLSLASTGISQESTPGFTSDLFEITSSIASSSPVNVESTSESNTEDAEEHIAVLKWKKAEKAAKKISAMIYKTILPFAVHSSSDLDLSPQCSRGLMKMLTGIKQMKIWAYKMLDSYGRISSGLFTGNVNALGDYDQCLGINVPGNFRGQYCTLDVSPPLPERRPFVSMHEEVPEFVNISRPGSVISEFLRQATHYYRLNFRSSVCVPSTCSREEVRKIANKVMEMAEIEFEVLVPNCETIEDKVEFTRSQIVIIIVLGILIFLGISATIVDVIMKLKSGEESYQDDLSVPLKCLLCFSFYTNTLRLLKPDKSTDSIKIFHGMKVITILWVILNHTYYYLNYQACGFLLNAGETVKELAFQFIINGFLNVETFFFISAVLITYGVMKMKAKKVNIGLYVFHRIWRLMPPFMLVIACVFLLPHLGSGPVWKEIVVDQLTEKCQMNWWTNMLFINNFIGSENMCLQWLWYIPVDTHLYFLSLLVIIPLKSNPRLAFIMNAVILVCGLIITAAFHVYYGLHPTAIGVFNHPDDINYYLDRGYFRTYVHCSTYCVGLVVGYILAIKPKLRISLFTNILGWLTAFVFALTVLYGVYDWNQGNVPDIAVSTLYTCTNKFVWSLSLAWVTIACMTGNGGIATSILSWSAFVPFGRLTYMAYLIHPIIHMLNTGASRVLIRTEHRTILYMYLGNVLLSFMVAYGLSLLFESPFMSLEKVIFSSRPSKKSDRSKQTDTEDQQSAEEQYKFEKNGIIENNGIYTIKIKRVEANG